LFVVAAVVGAVERVVERRAANSASIQFNQDALVGMNTNSTLLAAHQARTSARLCGEKLSGITYSRCPG
jgi:hypothetical protein